MEQVSNDQIDKDATEKKKYVSTPALRAAKLRYYHKNKEELDKKRYELYLKQKDTPEYKESIKISQKKFHEKKKLMKQLSNSNSNSNSNSSSDPEV